MLDEMLDVQAAVGSIGIIYSCVQGIMRGSALRYYSVACTGIAGYCWQCTQAPTSDRDSSTVMFAL